MNSHSIIVQSGASNRARVLTFGAITLILLTAACVSSGKYETALKERDELAEQKRAQREEFNRARSAGRSRCRPPPRRSRSG